MRIIEFYILRRIFILFAAVLVSAIGITWTVQLLDKIDFVTTSGQTFFAILKFSSLFIPSAISLVMPFALLIAITTILSTMNQDSELVVINASGASRYTIWKPVLFLALIASVVSFIVANFVTPHARLTMRSMVANAHSDLINTVIQEGSFRKLAENLYLQIGERRADGSIAHLFIVDERNPNLGLYSYSVSGSVVENKNGNYLVMQDGEIERQDRKDGNTSIIQFDSNTFNLGDFSTGSGSMTLYPKDQPLLYLFHPDPDDTHFQRRPLQYTAEIHRRLTDWLYPLVFAMIALILAGDARSHREAGISATFSAITLSLVIYWLGYFFGDRADNDLAYIPLLYITPLATIIFIAFLLLTNRHLALPAWFSDTLSLWSDKIKRLLNLNQKQDEEC